MHTQIVRCCDMPMGVTVILYTHSGTGLHMHKDCTYGIIGLLLVLLDFVGVVQLLVGHLLSYSVKCDFTVPNLCIY